MIEIAHLTKSFGGKKAIEDVSFVAEDGKVTGFLGPNGAGKSTTMRAALGLVQPQSGQALIDESPYVDLPSPMLAVGAALDTRAANKKRSAYNHLLSLAYSNGIPPERVDEVMDITGISSVKKKKVGTFSLGMSQRLSIAAALLGDPQNLIFDEPVNGLDPEGVKWVRDLCRYYAGQGRAILLSSHLMSEVAKTADNLVIIGQGKILERASMKTFIAEHSRHSIRIVTPEVERLEALLSALGQAHVEILPVDRDNPPRSGALRVSGIALEELTKLVASQQVITYELRPEEASLEDAYLALTHGQVEYRSAAMPSEAEAQQGSGASGAASADVVASDAGPSGARTADAPSMSGPEVNPALQQLVKEVPNQDPSLLSSSERPDSQTTQQDFDGKMSGDLAQLASLKKSYLTEQLQGARPGDMAGVGQNPSSLTQAQPNRTVESEQALARQSQVNPGQGPQLAAQAPQHAGPVGPVQPAQFAQPAQASGPAQFSNVAQFSAPGQARYPVQSPDSAQQSVPMQVSASELSVESVQPVEPVELAALPDVPSLPVLKVEEADLESIPATMIPTARGRHARQTQPAEQTSEGQQELGSKQ